MTTRAELLAQFRLENPEMTERVVTDPQLHIWAKSANRQICLDTRCIISNESKTFNSVADQQFYNLEDHIDNFFEIDRMPGGGVYYDNKPLDYITQGEMNYKRKRWKTGNSGTPKHYWQRGTYIWFDKAPPDDDIEIAVDCILYPDDLSADDQEPFNEIQRLQVFSDAIVKFMEWRAKRKRRKYDEARAAEKDFIAYTGWMKKRVRSSKYSSIVIKPRSHG